MDASKQCWLSWQHWWTLMPSWTKLRKYRLILILSWFSFLSSSYQTTAMIIRTKKNLFISPILPPAKTAKTRKSVLYLRFSFKNLSNFLTWFLMFRFPKVLRACGTLPPAVLAAMLALWLTTLLIIDATPPSGITWSSCVDVPRIEPGSESLSADWLLCILAWKELFCLLVTPVFFGPVLRFKQQPAWWRHRRGWQRKQEVGLIWWPEPMLEVSGSDKDVDFCSPSLKMDA